MSLSRANGLLALLFRECQSSWILSDCIIRCILQLYCYFCVRGCYFPRCSESPLYLIHGNQFIVLWTMDAAIDRSCWIILNLMTRCSVWGTTTRHFFPGVHCNPDNSLMTAFFQVFSDGKRFGQVPSNCSVYSYLLDTDDYVCHSDTLMCGRRVKFHLVHHVACPSHAAVGGLVVKGDYAVGCWKGSHFALVCGGTWRKNVRRRCGGIFIALDINLQSHARTLARTHIDIGHKLGQVHTCDLWKTQVSCPRLAQYLGDASVWKQV